MMLLRRAICTYSNINQCAIWNQCHIWRNRNKISVFKIPSRLATTVANEDEKPCMIYSGSLTPRIKAVKVFSLTTSLTGLAAQPILMEQGLKLGGTGLAIFLCGFAGFFTFITPFLLHYITKKYVTEMYFDPKKDEYNAITISFFLQKLENKFKISDVKVPEVPGMFTSFLIGKTPLFVDPKLFSDTEHYVKIMGYDKPIDFKLDPIEGKNKSDKSVE